MIVLENSILTHILVNNQKTRVWEMSDGKNITSKHPVVVNINYGNIEATAFVKVEPKNVPVKDIVTIIK